MAIGISSRSVLWNKSSVPFINKWSYLVLLDMLKNFDVNSRVNEIKSSNLCSLSDSSLFLYNKATYYLPQTMSGKIL